MLCCQYTLFYCLLNSTDFAEAKLNLKSDSYKYASINVVQMFVVIAFKYLTTQQDVRAP